MPPWRQRRSRNRLSGRRERLQVPLELHLPGSAGRDHRQLGRGEVQSFRRLLRGEVDYVRHRIIVEIGIEGAQLRVERALETLDPLRLYLAEAEVDGEAPHRVLRVPVVRGLIGREEDREERGRRSLLVQALPGPLRLVRKLGP